MIHANKGWQLYGHFILNMISALTFSFFTITRSLFIINHPETVNCCNLSLCLPTDFKMGVAATLPELSEWTLRTDNGTLRKTCGLEVLI